MVFRANERREYHDRNDNVNDDPSNFQFTQPGFLKI
jgi:hypothetical protein